MNDSFSPDETPPSKAADDLMDALLREHAERACSNDKAFLARIEQAIDADLAPAEVIQFRGLRVSAPALTAAAAVISVLAISLGFRRESGDVSIAEAPTQRVGEIRFEGNHAIPDTELRAQVKRRDIAASPHPGEVDPLGELLLELDLKAVERYYHRAGYAEAAVTGSRVVGTEAGAHDLIVTIAEGEKSPQSEASSAGETADHAAAPASETRISADQSKRLPGARIVRFEGNVTINHPDFVLTADVLDAEMREDAAAAPRIKRVTATGYVEVEKRTAGGALQEAKGQWAEYDAKTGDILLKDFPSLRDGANFVQGKSEDTAIRLLADGGYEVDGPVSLVQALADEKGALEFKSKLASQLSDHAKTRDSVRREPPVSSKSGRIVIDQYGTEYDSSLLPGLPSGAVSGLPLGSSNAQPSQRVAENMVVTPEPFGSDAASPSRINASKRRIQNLSYFEGVDILPVITPDDWKDLDIHPSESAGSFNFGAGLSPVSPFAPSRALAIGGVPWGGSFDYRDVGPKGDYGEPIGGRVDEFGFDFKSSKNDLELRGAEFFDATTQIYQESTGYNSLLSGNDRAVRLNLNDYLHDTRDDLFLPRKEATRLGLSGYLGLGGVEAGDTEETFQQARSGGDPQYIYMTVGGERSQRFVEDSALRMKAGNDMRPDDPLAGFREAPPVDRERYGQLVDNLWLSPMQDPLSTFSIDVDTASYTNIRRFINYGQEIPKDAVRIEEMINYFSYDYPQPEGEHPFSFSLETAACPWNGDHQLLRVGIHGREIGRDQRPDANLVFLLDVSGSMEQPEKLPLVIQSMGLLVEELRQNDKVSIVVYAGAEGLALPPTPGDKQMQILGALQNLRAGGSTNGGAGIKLAYKLAKENFIQEGINRVILCTDGDFNVGTTGQGELVDLVKERAKDGVFLSVLGFGSGNINDSMLEAITNDGNGVYYYIDNLKEARKVFVYETMGTLVTIAKDVKIQVEFNPAQVQSYRLIGYANRMLKKEDFEDDRVDAGEVGAGHSVTAFYEIVPADVEQPAGAISVPRKEPALRYQTNNPTLVPSEELAVVKLRYKQPDRDTSILAEAPVAAPENADWKQASDDFQFGAGVALFGMVLRGGTYCENADLQDVVEVASEGIGADPQGMRKEFVALVNARFTTLQEKEKVERMAAAQQPPSKTLAAIVNGEEITKQEVRNFAQQQVQLTYMQSPQMTRVEFEARAREIEQHALQELIDRTLIVQDFRNLKATIRAQHVDEAVNRFVRERFEGDRTKFLNELSSNGLSLTQFRKSQEETIIIQAMRARNAGSEEWVITPEEEKQFWTDNLHLFAQEGFVTLSTLTIPKLLENDPASAEKQRKLIDDLVARLRSGADFGELARQHSVDSGAQTSGERGTFAQADLNAKLAGVAFQIPVGAISDPVDLGDYYTVIRVTGREEAKVRPFEEVDEEVHRRMQEARRQDNVERWLAELRSAAEIKVFE